MLELFTAITESDIDAILSIESLSFPRPWLRGAFLSELGLPGAVSLSARHTEADGRERIVAYIFFRLVADEMHILKIAVAPDWRGHGIAKALINKSLELADARGCRGAYLEVRPANTAAGMLYHKLGFRVIGKRTNYYSETGEDALVMRKDFKGAI